MEIENKDLGYIAALVVIAMIAIGGTIYNAYDTGEEITCRTGNGWTVLEEYDDFYKAECQYKTKDWVLAYCSSFRSTPSYERYGCNVVILAPVEPEPVDPGQQPYVPYYEGVGDFSLCSFNSKTCVPCNPSPDGCIPIG